MINDVDALIGDQMATSLQTVDERAAEIAGESSKDPLALFMSKVEREQVRAAIQQLSD